MSEFTIGRQDILDALRAGVAEIPWFRAVWSGGSDASGRTDEISDVDLFCIVEDDRVEDGLAAVRRILESVSPIEHEWRLPSPTPFGCEQAFVRLRDTADWHMVDVVMMKAGDDELFLERERHGEPLVLLDRDGLVQPVPLDRERLLQRMKERLPVLRERFAIFNHFAIKAARRGAHADAIHSYVHTTLNPLIELLRMRHCPELFDYGPRYLDRDLPEDQRQIIEELSFVPSIDDLPDWHARAVALFEENLRALDAGEWSLG